MHLSTDFDALMAQAAALYEAGKIEPALVAFDQARGLRPLHLQAIAACATLLSQLNQPQAAYRLLAEAKELLWHDADGVANLAIAAETCGQDDEAVAAYARALELDPNHLRSLNNLGLRAAARLDWPGAVAKAARCVELAPQEPLLWMNWADFLTGARREDEALAQLNTACERFPDSLPLAIRRYVSLAFNGQFDAAQQALQVLGKDTHEGQQLVDAYLASATASLPKQFQKHNVVAPDASDFYALRAFDRLQVCDWRHNDTLTQLIGQKLKEAETTRVPRDWRDAQFYALVLDLTESQQTQLRVVTGNAIDATQKLTPNWLGFKTRARRMHQEEPLRIGISTQTLADARYTASLSRQLDLHDRSRFDFYLYSPADLRADSGPENLRAYARNLVDISHMSDAEAAGRIRVDQLDLWMDTAFYTPWCRPELPALRVAPVQLRQQTWQRVNPPIPCEYTIGDVFTHPGPPNAAFGAIARLPHTCWLSTGLDGAAAAPVTRGDAGLPADAFVMCAFGPALMVDPHTFAQWMKILRALPHAVLWLPAYVHEARANLLKAAQAAGVVAQQIIFAERGPRAELLAKLPLADVFLDTLRFNANHNLADALYLGVPAVTVAGHNMASRLGGSIIRAAGLADCVFETAEAYCQAVVTMGQQPDQLAALRARLAAQQQPGPDCAPLFDTPSRVREWEHMWTQMIGRQRAGLPPESFDVL